MAMTNSCLKKQMDSIKEYENRVKHYKELKDLYEELFNQGIMLDDKRRNVEHMMRRYRAEYDASVKNLHLYKMELNNTYNVDAFGYDTPILLDDSYYEKRFKQHGCFVGIKF